MELLLSIFVGLIVIIGLIFTVIIAYKIFMSVILYVVGFIISIIILIFVLIGLGVLVNYHNEGTPFNHGRSWSEGIHYIMESTKNKNKDTKPINKIKSDLSVIEISGPHQIAGPTEIK